MKQTVKCGIVILAILSLASIILEDVGEVEAFGWTSAKQGEVPRNAIPGGQDGGQTLYICTASYKNGEHPGKVGAGLGGCNIGWGGKEVTVPFYRVLTGGSDEVRWSSGYSSGGVPSDAVKGGYYTNGGYHDLYICRDLIRGGIHPGKVSPDIGACHIGWGGKEHRAFQYEVLISNIHVRQ